MRRPFKDIRPIGPLSQRPSANPNPEGSMVVARIDVSDIDNTGGMLDSEFVDDFTNVMADGVAEATQSSPGSVGATPINFDEAVMLQPFPVPVGSQFQKAVVAMLYDEDLSREAPNIEDNLELRTDRVQRVDVFPV